MDKHSSRGQHDTNRPYAATRPRAAARAAEQTSGSDRSRELALAVAAAGLEKKAAGVEIIDVVGKVDYTEFLVLMSGRSDRHVHAIARGVEEHLRRQGAPALSVEGLGSCLWVLLDFNDVVVHVFQQEARAYYDLEGLWIDASRVSLPEIDRVRRSHSSRPPDPSEGD